MSKKPAPQGEEATATMEWRECTWGQLASLEYGKRLSGYDESDGPYRVFGTNGPIGWANEALCSHPTVIVGRKGAYRGVEYSLRPCFVIDTAFFLEPRCTFDMQWACYAISAVDIDAMDSGSAIPSTSRESFYALPVRVPPLPEQRAIARVLGALDDKIELNRRMNRMLEALARALFNAWFVDFEPVRAKMAGRPPQSCSPEVAALFPDELVSSELGLVPRGWKVGQLKQIAENPRDGVKPDAMDGDTAYISLSDMPQKSISLDSWSTADSVTSGKYAFRRGDILFGKLRPYFHKVGPAPVGGVCSTDILVLRPRKTEYHSYALLLVSSARFVAHTTAGSTGTKMPRTNWSAMGAYELALPPEKVAAAFNGIVSPMREALIANIHEARTLAELRDTLLPKLISGQVRVPVPLDAEEALL